MKNNTTDIALLLIRIGLGAVFVAHGYDKLMDMESTKAFFSTIELSPFWAYLVAWVELLGGLSMFLGVATGWAGILLAVTMVGAIMFLKLSKGFLGGYEFDMMLFLASIAIAFSGPGAYVLKWVWKKG